MLQVSQPLRDRGACSGILVPLSMQRSKLLGLDPHRLAVRVGCTAARSFAEEVFFFLLFSSDSLLTKGGKERKGFPLFLNEVSTFPEDHAAHPEVSSMPTWVDRL